MQWSWSAGDGLSNPTTQAAATHSHSLCAYHKWFWHDENILSNSVGNYGWQLWFSSLIFQLANTPTFTASCHQLWFESFLQLLLLWRHRGINVEGCKHSFYVVVVVTRSSVVLPVVDMATLLLVEYLTYLWSMHQLWHTREKTQCSICKQPGLIHCLIRVVVVIKINIIIDTWTSCTLKSFPPLSWQAMWLTLPQTTLFRRGLLWELLNSFLTHMSYWRHTDSVRRCSCPVSSVGRASDF